MVEKKKKTKQSLLPNVVSPVGSLGDSDDPYVIILLLLFRVEMKSNSKPAARALSPLPPSPPYALCTRSRRRRYNRLVFLYNIHTRVRVCVYSCALTTSVYLFHVGLTGKSDKRDKHALASVIERYTRIRVRPGKSPAHSAGQLALVVPGTAGESARVPT